MKKHPKTSNCRKILALLLSLSFSCCSLRKESPTIYISNLTKNPVSNVVARFPAHSVKIDNLYPGNTNTTTYNIKQTTDFFGNVKISWQNHLKEESSYEFSIESDKLKSFFNKKIFSYIQIYIKDFDAEILYYDDYNSGNIMAQKDIILKDLRTNYEIENKYSVKGSLLPIDYKSQN